MANENLQVTKFINNSAPFAQPILTHLRAIVHAACPAVEETIKWGHPHFLYHGMMCNMASFKAHCAFGFWKGPLVCGDDANREAMGQFGRITSVADLPPKRAITVLVKRAMQLNVDGVAAPRVTKSRTSKAVVIPPALAIALSRQPAAKLAFSTLSPSHRREYCEWIAEAKRETTVATRVAKTIEQISTGKSLNWKYERPSSATTAPAKKRVSGSKTA